MGCIYEICNLANGRVYVGSAMDIQKRQREHLCLLRQGRHYNKHLQNAWCKYGEEMFVFRVVEEVDDDQLIEREQVRINATESFLREKGYNARHIAESNMGLKWSAESRQRQSKAQEGKTISDEHREKLFLGRKAYVVTEEHKRKIGIANKGRIPWCKGRKVWTIEQRQAIGVRTANALTGRKLSEEHKQNIVNAMPRGEDSPAAKLTESQVAEIRALLRDGIQGKELAHIYSVGTSTISRIKRGISWASAVGRCI